MDIFLFFFEVLLNHLFRGFLGHRRRNIPAKGKSLGPWEPEAPVTHATTQEGEKSRGDMILAKVHFSGLTSISVCVMTFRNTSKFHWIY